MSPIERLARKLRELTLANGGQCRGEDETGWRDYIDDARALLAALREPSAAMLAVDPTGPTGSIFPEELWRAMIDAAIEEG